MKIFSLQTKKHLTGWALILGFIVNIFIQYKTLIWAGNCPAKTSLLVDECGPVTSGWPFNINLNSPSNGGNLLLAMLNFGFWVLVSLVILFLIRYFINKPAKV